MKKIFTVLALLTILGASTPAFSAPPPPPPQHGGGHGGGYVHAGPRHEMRRPPHHHGGYYRPHSGFTIYTGYPRHEYFYNHGLGGYPYCMCPYCMAHRAQSGVGFYFSF